MGHWLHGLCQCRYAFFSMCCKIATSQKGGSDVPPPPPLPQDRLLPAKKYKCRGRLVSVLEMISLLVVLCSAVCLAQEQPVPVAGSQPQDSVGSAQHFLYSAQDRLSANPPIIFTVPRDDDLGPAEMDYPVKTVQRFTDSDGNVQVVTSYANRNDNPLPIYRAAPIPPVAYAQPAPIYAPQPAPYTAPRARSSAVEVEERSVPKKQQMSRTKTIRFPDASGQLVNHEEKTSFRDANAKSFQTESSYDNSYKPRVAAGVVSADSTESRAKFEPKASYDEGYDDDSGGEPEVEDEVAVRSAYQKAKESAKVPVVSAKPVRAPKASYRSAKRKDEVPVATAATKKVDQVQPAGSAYHEVHDSDEDDSYDRSDGYYGYDEHHGGIGVDHGGIGHVDGGIGHVDGGIGDIGDHHHHHVGGHHHGGHDHHHGHDHGIDKKFAKGHGQSFQQGEHFAKGEKGGKGHKSKESYDKGHVEKHGQEHNKGGKKIEEGEKKGHIDEHNHYHKGHAHHKGEKGTDKAHSKGHKKGKKTKGFRTVHHKDEYKKDEVFYDEEHDAGHEKHHGHEHGGHQEAKGGETKKGHLNSGYKDAVKGVEGQKKEGHSYEHSKGHQAHQGHKAQEGHKEGFAKGEGHKGEEAHGHVHESKGKGHYK